MNLLADILLKQHWSRLECIGIGFTMAGLASFLHTTDYKLLLVPFTTQRKVARANMFGFNWNGWREPSKKTDQCEHDWFTDRIQPITWTAYIHDAGISVLFHQHCQKCQEIRVANEWNVNRRD